MPHLVADVLRKRWPRRESKPAGGRQWKRPAHADGQPIGFVFTSASWHGALQPRAPTCTSREWRRKVARERRCSLGRLVLLLPRACPFVAGTLEAIRTSAAAGV